MLCVMTWRISQRSLRATAEEHLARMARVAAVTIRPVMTDAAALQRRVADLRTRSGERVTVIDATGTVLADSDTRAADMENHKDRPEVVAALAGREGHDRRTSHSVGVAFLYTAVPFVADDRVTHVIRVAAPVTELERREADLVEWIAVALLVALPASLIIAYFLSKALADPIQQVSALAQRLATGDLSTRVEASDVQEVDQVARSLDAMRAHLAERIREVQQQRQDLEVTLSRLEEGVVSLDREGRVITANTAARRYLGVDSPIFGQPLRDHLTSRGLVRLWEEAQSGNVTELRRDVSLTVMDETLTISAVVIRVDWPDTPIAWLLCLRDITALAQSVAMKTDFVANASHELRTPVATIRAAIDTLADDSLDAPSRRRFLDVIHRSVERLQNMTEDLMHLNRVESPTFEPQRSRFNPTDVLNALAGQFADRIRAKQATLDLDGDVREMIGDRRSLELILKNLLDNAIKFIAEGGRVSLRCRRDGRHVRFEVADNGCGIPPEDQDRVFERFYQVDKSRSQNLGGTGLGLAIVKHAVQALGGELTLTSAVGAGTTIVIVLPDSE